MAAAERPWKNFSSCCRLCLAEKMDSMKSIFENGDLVHNIRNCVGIEVQATDKISTMICEQCLSKIDTWNDFRSLCTSNQAKLVNWLNTWSSVDLANTSIQIKDEILDDEVDEDEPILQIDSETNGDVIVQIKTERIDIEDDIYDQPPPLTPHPPEEMIPSTDDESQDENEPIVNNSVEETILVNGDDMPETPQNTDGKNCRICNKVFSSAANRRKHENMMHRPKTKQQQVNTSVAVPPTENESDKQKIEFAAGLQLQQKSSKEIPNGNVPLTKIEISYLEKCKTIVKMTESLTCACHEETFTDVKDLFTHLKKQRSWFAMFTCYNCLITFGDRSSYSKHLWSCPRELLQNLKRLSESPVNPEVKIRLYQSYKCIRCNCIFSFNEDFNSHFDVDHMEMLQDQPPYTCLCSKSFEEVEEYKQHLHISCFLRYFCDICFGTFSTMDAFKTHCEKEHDLAEGSLMQSFDVQRKHKSVDLSPADPVPKKRSLPVDFKTNETQGKRRRTITIPDNAPLLEPEDPDYTPEPCKVINPHAIRPIGPATCSAEGCEKVYSTFQNMVRHYKTAHDPLGRILPCQLCMERFRYHEDLIDHEAAVHGINTDAVMEEMEQAKYSCSDCGFLTNNVNEWKQHMESHQTKNCDECGMKFTSQNELEQHRNVHLNIKVYRDSKTQDYKSTMITSVFVCKICNKSFGSKGELRQHNLLHATMPVLVANDESDLEEKKPVLIEKKSGSNSNSKKYSCNLCNKHYVSYGGIWDHNKKHHSGMQMEEFPRLCGVCNKLLSSKGAWTNHQKTHNEDRNLVPAANPTRVSTPTPVPVRSKSRMKDDEDSDYHTCKKCFKVFCSKYNLRNHMKLHGIMPNINRSSSKTGKLLKTYWCDVCHQACQGYADLQSHKQEHLEEAAPALEKEAETDVKKPFTFSCDICSAAYSTNFALRRHREKHGTDSQVKANIYCKYCKIPFDGMSALNEHMLDEHDQQLPSMQPVKVEPEKLAKKFACDVCKKVFDNASALSSHQGWHKRGKFGKKILKTQEMMLMNEKKPAEVKCFSCSKTFVNDTALQIHILEVHKNAKKKEILSCNSCKLTFDDQSTYNTHMQLHKVVESQQKMASQPPKKSKPHPCKFCPAGFSRSDTLSAHVRHHHKDYYSDLFKCSYCDRAFDKQNALTMHLKMHEKPPSRTSEPPPKPANSKNIYFCSICDVGFVLAKDLRNHVVTAHPF